MHEQNIICCKKTYLYAVIYRSRGGLLANENEEKNTSNDNIKEVYALSVIFATVVCVLLLIKLRRFRSL